MPGADSNLRTDGHIPESVVVNPHGYTNFTAVRLPAGIQSESEPAIEIVSHAAASSTRIRFKRTGERKQAQWLDTSHSCVGIQEGIPTEELPLWSGLVLRSRRGAKRTQHKAHERQHYEETAQSALELR